jgi:hypothetical protein
MLPPKGLTNQLAPDPVVIDVPDVIVTGPILIPLKPVGIV